jgi:Na+-transporting NADH:ubiquinone oxidoreductase subunit E
MSFGGMLTGGDEPEVTKGTTVQEGDKELSQLQLQNGNSKTTDTDTDQNIANNLKENE